MIHVRERTSVIVTRSLYAAVAYMLTRWSVFVFGSRAYIGTVILTSNRTVVIVVVNDRMISTSAVAAARRKTCLASSKSSYTWYTQSILFSTSWSPNWDMIHRLTAALVTISSCPSSQITVYNDRGWTGAKMNYTWMKCLHQSSRPIGRETPEFRERVALETCSPRSCDLSEGAL